MQTCVRVTEARMFVKLACGGADRGVLSHQIVIADGQDPTSSDRRAAPPRALVVALNEKLEGRTKR